MKKLSELLKQQKTIEEQRTNTLMTEPQPTQSLVLFNGVLSGEKLLQSPEIEKLVNYCYGGLALTLSQTEYAEQLHDWAREEQYKADVGSRAMTYPMKAKFEDLTLDTYSNQFSGPLYVQVFHPAETIYDVLTITCRWNDGIFRNEYYVVGIIADSKDLGMIIQDRIIQNPIL